MLLPELPSLHFTERVEVCRQRYGQVGTGSAMVEIAGRYGRLFRIQATEIRVDQELRKKAAFAAGVVAEDLIKTFSS